VIDHGDLVAAVSRRADVDGRHRSGRDLSGDREVARHLLNESRERLATVFPDAARYAATTLGEMKSRPATRSSTAW